MSIVSQPTVIETVKAVNHWMFSEIVQQSLTILVCVIDRMLKSIN